VACCITGGVAYFVIKVEWHVTLQVEWHVAVKVEWHIL